jgi:hypothetical protein
LSRRPSPGRPFGQVEHVRSRIPFPDAELRGALRQREALLELAGALRPAQALDGVAGQARGGADTRRSSGVGLAGTARYIAKVPMTSRSANPESAPTSTSAAELRDDVAGRRPLRIGQQILADGNPVVQHRRGQQPKSAMGALRTPPSTGRKMRRGALPQAVRSRSTSSTEHVASGTMASTASVSRSSTVLQRGAVAMSSRTCRSSSMHLERPFEVVPRRLGASQR